MLEKEELIETIKDCAECLGVKYITEEVLEQAMLTWSYNPFSCKGSYVFKTAEGFLSVPTAYKEGVGEYLDITKAYIASENEIQNALKLLKQCYDEISMFVRSEF